MAIRLQTRTQVSGSIRLQEAVRGGAGLGACAGEAGDADGRRAAYYADARGRAGRMAVYQCEPKAGDGPPPMPARRKIERTWASGPFEHIVIFTDRGAHHGDVAVGQARDGSAGAHPRAHVPRGQPGDPLLQKLAGIAFELDELDEDGRVAIGVGDGQGDQGVRRREGHQAVLRRVQGRARGVPEVRRGHPAQRRPGAGTSR